MKKINYLLGITGFLMLSFSAFSQTNTYDIFRKKSPEERLEKRKELAEKRHKEFEKNLRENHVERRNLRKTEDTLNKPLKGYYLLNGTEYSYNFTYIRDENFRIVEEYRMDTVISAEQGKAVYMYDQNGKQVSYTEYYYNGLDYIPFVKDSSAYHPDYPEIQTYDALYEYDKMDEEWQLSWANKTTITLESGNIASITNYNSDETGTWVLNSERACEYDANNRLSSILNSFYWNGNTYAVQYKEEYTFDANGVLSAMNTYYSEDEEWIEEYKLVDFAFNNFQSNSIIEYFVLYTLDIFHDAQFTNYTGYYWDEEEWVLEVKAEVDYSENGYEMTNYYWDGEEFIPSDREITMNSATEEILLGQSFDESTNEWLNSYRDIEFYSLSGEHLGYKSEGWIEETREWEIWSWEQLFRNFGTNGEILDETYQVFDFSNSILETEYKRVFTEWKDFASLTEIDMPLSYAIYPNPSNDFVIIHFEQAKNENKNIRISDISGRTVRQISDTADRIILPLQEFKPGIYFVEVSNGQNMSVSKLIKK